MPAARPQRSGAAPRRGPALLEELRAPVLGPPHAAAVERRTGRNAADAGNRPLPARRGVELDQTRRAVEILLERQHPPAGKRLRPTIGRVILFGQFAQRRGGVLHLGKRGPKVVQLVERAAEKVRNACAVILFQGHAGGEEDIGVARAVPRDLVPDVLAETGVGIGTNLIAQLVLVGHMAAVGTAEPAVEVATVAADVVHRPVGERKRRLQSAAERRHGGLGHDGVALHGPDGHAQQTDGRPLLPEHITQRADEAAVEVVVLHGMTVLVGHELLAPRHRIALDGGRREELDALGQEHDQPVRAEILGVHDERDAHGSVAEPVADVGPDGADVEKRAGREVGNRVGVDDPHVGRADGRPPEVGRVGTPRIILGPDALQPSQQGEREEKMKPPFQNQLPACLQR